ncbi:MAG: hypothetical protein LBT05_13365 [Planctomycetaceae bacterium]|jgi:hypothetical protein|nr:hypothetical protein [Planctomycetaceae bacterium]
MNQKITRRVVLGTAISGLVAGPFVIRALRQEKKLEMGRERECPYSEGRTIFFHQWKDIYNTFLAKQKPIDTPKIFSVKYDFSRPRSLAFRSLETFFTGDFDLPETAQLNNMMQYTFMEGTINVKDGKMYVSVDKHEQKHLEIDVDASRKNGAEVVETRIKNPNGTTTTIESVARSGFYYNSATQRYKTSVIEKEVTSSLTIGQFILNQSRSLDLDRENFHELLSTPHGQKTIFLARHLFFPLIRFPLPEHPIEVGKNFECSLNSQDIACFKLPLYKASFQGMVECHGFKAMTIVPQYDSGFAPYSQFLRKQYHSYCEALKEGYLTDKQAKEVAHAFSEIITTKENRFKNGIPKLKYLIDSETGCVVRRKEYDTSKKYPKTTSAVQRIFQLS